MSRETRNIIRKSSNDLSSLSKSDITSLEKKYDNSTLALKDNPSFFKNDKFFPVGNTNNNSIIKINPRNANGSNNAINELNELNDISDYKPPESSGRKILSFNQNKDVTEYNSLSSNSKLILDNSNSSRLLIKQPFKVSFDNSQNNAQHYDKKPSRKITKALLRKHSVYIRDKTKVQTNDPVHFLKELDFLKEYDKDINKVENEDETALLYQKVQLDEFFNCYFVGLSMLTSIFVRDYCYDAGLPICPADDTTLIVSLAICSVSNLMFGKFIM